MNYISDSQLINKIASKILEPKKIYYNEDQIHMTLLYLQHILYYDIDVQNMYGQHLKGSLFKDKFLPPNVCILYMHGFGSNRIEAVNILPYLPKEYALCCFDFSAQGKSQGKIITYGQKEKNDIHAVLQYLRKQGFKKFALWGRSMGASCSLNYTLQHKPGDIFLQVLDSPFSSFSEVALEIAKKRVNFPQALINLGLEMVKKNCQKEQHSPFLVDFNKAIYCMIPTIFLYNPNDEVVSYKNSETIIDNFKGHYEKFLIQEKHNGSRTARTLKIIINSIKKYEIKKDKKIKFHQNLQNSERQTEKIKMQFKKTSSSKGGINVINSFRQTKNFDHYGIWVSSKFTEEETKQNDHGINLIRSQASVPKRPQSIKVVSAELFRNSMGEKQLKRSVHKKKLTQSTASTGFYESGDKKLKNKFYL